MCTGRGQQRLPNYFGNNKLLYEDDYNIDPNRVMIMLI